MPTYEVTDPKSGKTLELTGDSPPSEQELEQVFSSVSQQTQKPQENSLLSGLKAFGGAIVKPVVEYGKFLGESVAQAGRAVLDPTMRTDIGKAQSESTSYMNQSRDLTRQASQVTDPVVKRNLLDKAKALAQSADAAMSGVRSLGQSQQTFYTKPEEIASQGDIALSGLKKTAGAAAYAIPGGAGVQGAMKAGLLSGALTGIAESERGKEISGGLAGGLIGGLAGGVMAKGGQLLQKGGKKLMEKAAPKVKEVSEIAARQYANIFQISKNKGTRGLDPVKTSKSLLKYNIIGNSLDDLTNKASVVTGKDGTLTKAVRETLDLIPVEIDASNAPLAAKNALRGKYGFDAKKTNEVVRTINSMIPQGSKINKANALDVFDMERQLQAQAAAYRKSFNANKLPEDEVLADAFSAAYNELADRIDDQAAKYSLVDAIKTPERIDALRKISPQLADDFLNAKTIRDLRSLQKPFVDTMMLAAETSAKSTSILNQLIERGAGSMVGASLGGVPGAVLGGVVAPVLEPVLKPFVEAGRIGATTRIARAVNKGINTEPVRQAVGKTVEKAGETLMSPFAQRAVSTQAANKAVNR